MTDGTCNKCRFGSRQEGDSWCLGCSSLEATAADLRREWPQAEFRSLAEDIILSAARAVRGLRKAANRLEEEPQRKVEGRASVPARPPPVTDPRRSTTAGATAKVAPAVEEAPNTTKTYT